MTCVWSEMLFLYISYVICKYFVCQSNIQQEKLTEIIFSGVSKVTNASVRIAGTVRRW